MFGKGLKQLILLGLFVSFVILMTLSVKKLLKGTTNFSSTSKESRCLMPSFTVCPGSKHMFLEHGYDSQTVMEKLNSPDEYPFPIHIEINGHEITDDHTLKQIRWKKEDTFSVNCLFLEKKCLPCLTVTPKEGTIMTKHGAQIIFREDEGIYKEFLTFLHDRHHEPSFLNGKDLNFGQAIYSKFKNEVLSEDVRNLKQVNVQSLSKDERLCDESNGQNKRKTSMKLFNKALGCNIPWYREKDKYQMDCSSEKDFEKYFKIGRNFSKMYENDMFMPNCLTTIWTINSLYTDHTYEKSNDSLISIQLFSYYHKIEILSEHEAYDFKTFIGDFGGYLGLLLGSSIPGVLDLFESLMSRMVNKVSREKMEQTGN